MNIDATIFVQAINFFILYISVKWLWLKPCVTIIDEQKEALNEHNQHAETKKEAIALLKDRTQQERHQAHLYFNTNQPELLQHKKIAIKEIAPLPEPNTEEINTLSEQTAKEIIKKIDGSV